MLDLWLAMLLDASLKGLALCLAAAGAAFLLRRASAAARHLVWRLAFVGLLALPVLAAVVPEWRVLPGESQAKAAATFPPRALTSPALLSQPPALPPGEEGDSKSRQHIEPLSGRRGVGERWAGAPSPGGRTGGWERVGVRAFWQPAAFLLWLAGVLAVLTPLAIALVRVSWLRRRARPVEDEDWLRLLGRVRAELNVRVPVELVEGEERAMPMTWGWRRPVVLLPAGAGTWSAPRRRAVLLHELAHVARRDFLTQIAAEVARALYWFNPLVWRAVRALRLESEHACDDQVLAAGAPATDYAGDLLEIARSLRAGRIAAPAGLAMARPSELTGRLLAVLDARRSRRGVSRRLALPAWIAAAAVVLPLAALSPAAPEAATVLAQAKPAPPARPAPPRPPAPPPPVKEGSDKSWFSGFLGFGTHSYVHTDDDGRTVRLQTRGNMDLTEDWTGIARLSRGAEVRFEEEAKGVERRLDVTPGSGGRPVYRYRVNGKERAFDAEGRKWLQAMLLEYLRRSGYKADERVAWILKRQGPAGVLAEVSHIQGDYGTRIYLEQLFKQARLEPALVERAFRQAGRQIESDYELRQALTAALDRQVLTEAAALAYAEASQGIGSDYEARQALSPLVFKFRHNARTLSALLQVSKEIGSDYELAELLEDVAGEYALADPGVRSAYVEAVAGIGSDYETRRALSAAVERGDLSPDTLAAVLQAAEKQIGSGHELSSLLVEVAREYTLTGPTRQAYVKAMRSIGSSHDRERAEKALGGR
jgi:beta-lactamase regulating signal transducer with metallopeptidase domain